MGDSKVAHPPTFSAIVQRFFTDYLVTQRALSPNTVASYRDAFSLFLDFASSHLGKVPTKLHLNDIEPDLVLAFLDYLEQHRKNSTRSRNQRLTALRTFLNFAGRQDVSSLLTVERVLSVPMKRFERPLLEFLTREEMLAVIGTPSDTWISRRDHLLLTMLYNTGARVSEIINLRVADVVLGRSASVHIHGKGRKQRIMPLWKSTAREIQGWLHRNPALVATKPLLPNRDGGTMTRSNANLRFRAAVTRACRQEPSLAKRRLSPHSIRHSTAMHMLQSGVAFSVIALWLGHESPTTTHQYVEADLAMKELALARIQEPDTRIRRYRPPDALLQFLQSL